MDDQAAAQWARGTIRSEMTKRGMTYADLARELAARGVVDTEKNLANKVARGTFSAAFFFQCMEAIQVTVLHLDVLDMHGTYSRVVKMVQAGLDADEKGRDSE